MNLKHRQFFILPSHIPSVTILSSLLLFLLFSSSGCSRSPWVKPDGHEVSSEEQIECVTLVDRTTRGDNLSQEALQNRIEQCMLDKGYQRRPWWLLNDLHWHIKEPSL